MEARYRLLNSINEMTAYYGGEKEALAAITKIATPRRYKKTAKSFKRLLRYFIRIEEGKPTSKIKHL